MDRDGERVQGIQMHGYFAHKKPPHPRTLQYAYAQGLMVVLEGVTGSYERGTPVRHAG